MIIQRNYFTHHHFTRSLRLENEILEETQIQEIEAEIGDAKRKGTSIDSLKKQREDIVEGWIGRLEKEIAKAGKNLTRKGNLQDQLRRAKDYLET